MDYDGNPDRTFADRINLNGEPVSEVQPADESNAQAYRADLRVYDASGGESSGQMLGQLADKTELTCSFTELAGSRYSYVLTALSVI